MTAYPVEHKLAAILHADVVGFSRLMGADEAGTHQRLKDALDFFTTLINAHQGRVVNTAGDAILADFTSISDALNCAVEVQRGLSTRNRPLPEAHKIRFRIGINLGEVIVDGGDIYGDEVNIAARLETLAEPEGVCISESARNAIGNKLVFTYHDRGEQPVKNIAQPVRAYRVIWQDAVQKDDVHPRAADTSGTTAPAINKTSWLIIAGLLLTGLISAAAGIGYWQWQTPDWSIDQLIASRQDPPSIAVLPFANMSNDPEQTYFADGMTEDLITDLSKISGLFVIARNSVFAYKDQVVDIPIVARELGVRYILEGSVRRAGERVRINAQLIDATSGAHLWAERYDRQLENIFDLQDEISGHIVTALALKLTPQEQQRLTRHFTDNLEAYDLYQRARALVASTETDRERELYRRAIALDPGFARAYGALAISHALNITFSQSENIDQDLGKAFSFASQAVALDNDLPQAHLALSMAFLMKLQHDQALASVQRAIEINPNYADAYTLLAWIRLFTGDNHEAVRQIAQTMRLNPLAHNTALTVLGQTRYFTHRFDETIRIMETATERNPENVIAYLFLTAAYQRVGRREDAEWTALEALNLTPDFSINTWRYAKLYTGKGVANFEHLADSLRQAGLPDHFR